MLTLYQFPRAFGLPNPSPFCVKVETYLRMVGLPYTISDDVRTAMGRAPKGKLPFIEVGGLRIADSSLILSYLKETHGDPLDADLRPTELAHITAYTRLMEDHLFWTLIQGRWLDDAGFLLTREAMLGGIPRSLRGIIAYRTRRNLRKQLLGHGMGRHTVEEIYALGCADLDALSRFLDDKPYFLGDRPTTLDTVAYGFLANCIAPPHSSPVEQHARSLANLVAYCRRMHGTYYPELPPIPLPVGGDAKPEPPTIRP
jgi:glutathione S-transferase